MRTFCTICKSGPHGGPERPAYATGHGVRVAVRPRQLDPDLGVLDVVHGHRRYLRRAATSITALLRMRHTVATVSVSLRADTGVGRFGQTIRVISLSSVLKSSTRNRSDRLIRPAARVMGDDWDTVPPSGIEVPVCAYLASRDRPLVTERRSQLGSGRADVSIHRVLTTRHWIAVRRSFVARRVVGSGKPYK